VPANRRRLLVRAEVDEASNSAVRAIDVSRRPRRGGGRIGAIHGATGADLCGHGFPPRPASFAASASRSSAGDSLGRARGYVRARDVDPASCRPALWSARRRGADDGPPTLPLHPPQHLRVGVTRGEVRRQSLGDARSSAGLQEPGVDGLVRARTASASRERRKLAKRSPAKLRARGECAHRRAGRRP